MLKLDDGFARGRPEFKVEVQHLQRLLKLIGYPLTADGYFGVGTQTIIKQLQQTHAHAETGEVDSKTWQLIESNLSSNQQSPTVITTTPVDSTSSPAQVSSMTSFQGDLAWIHTREGHAGKAYWPGGASGVTLDPGFDLGQQDKETIEEQYAHLLTPQQLSACLDCQGLKGRSAKSHLNNSITLLGIRISKAQALKIFPSVIEPYWVAINKKFPRLNNVNTPPAVQTALLSLGFNRGVYNKALRILSSIIEQEQWHECAEIIADMQQNHKLMGIRKRRRMEAKLILDAII